MEYAKELRALVGDRKLIYGAAVCIIADDEGRILLTRRCDNGEWCLPGGVMDFGETLEQAAIREAKEETGLDVKVDYLSGIYSGYITSDGKNQPIVAAFAAHKIGGELYCDHVETQELKYFSAEELPVLYRKQHIDMANDYFSGVRGIYR